MYPGYLRYFATQQNKPKNWDDENKLNHESLWLDNILSFAPMNSQVWIVPNQYAIRTIHISIHIPNAAANAYAITGAIYGGLDGENWCNLYPISLVPMVSDFASIVINPCHMTHFYLYLSQAGDYVNSGGGFIEPDAFPMRVRILANGG